MGPFKKCVTVKKNNAQFDKWFTLKTFVTVGKIGNTYSGTMTKIASFPSRPF